MQKLSFSLTSLKQLLLRKSEKTVEVKIAIQLPADSKDLTPAIRIDEHELAEALSSTAPLIMVLGRAGTGKTTFVRKLKTAPGRQQVILAYTGVAALNAGGQTLHSFFGLPWAITDLTKIRPSRKLMDIAPHLERIVIDEISMVRPDIIDAVDHCLKAARKCSLPFGGVQMVFVGDFLQLPPIVKIREREVLQQLGYATVSPIAAKCLQNVKTHVIHLHKVHRQNDRAFINLLGSVRRGGRPRSGDSNPQHRMPQNS